MKKGIQDWAGGIFLICVVLTILTVQVIAEVSSPTSVTPISSSGFNTSLYAAVNTTAMAGNVTELTIVGVSPTRAWQGYYGNITGTIVLEDAIGNVFYNWSVAEPKGEIFASNESSITWAGIHCFNYTANGSPEINLTIAETAYNIQDLDADGINETFNETNHSAVDIGLVTLGQDTCPTTWPFTDTGYQKSFFTNMLLTDNSSLVFATIIENDDVSNTTDITGFNGVAYDFQMLVAEDGHGTDTNPTTYFFWVELS